MKKKDLRNIVIHCDTKESAAKVKELANKLGWKTCIDRSYDSFDVSYAYGADTCYNLLEGRYGNIGLYKSDGFDIKSAEWFLSNFSNKISKEIRISIPKGFEIDKENSTFECIKFKPIENKIKVWDDLIDVELRGFWIDNYSNIRAFELDKFSTKDENVAFSEKVCKSMLAMAQISQLMPYYGGEVTKEEWGNLDLPKYTIIRNGNNAKSEINYSIYSLLAFRTKEYRDEFWKNNEQLVNDYLMIE